MDNVLLVKYDSTGAAQWAQTLTSGTTNALFEGVAVDSSGNVYAAGYLDRGTTDGFGNGVSATGIATVQCVLLVKYNSYGQAQWAQTLVSGNDNAYFTSVAVDSSGNVYAAGDSNGAVTLGYGNGVTATSTGSTNVLLVKYNTYGQAQWAQTLVSGANAAQFNGVAVDSSGNVYAGGICAGGAFGFGNNVTATGTSGSENVLLVKYNSTGQAQWAQTLTAGNAYTEFTGVAVDSSGNVFASGLTQSAAAYGFGNGVTATGSSATDNVLLVKYNSSGTAQWAQTLVSGTDDAGFAGVGVDPSGNVYAAGDVSNAGIDGFGNGVTVSSIGSTNVLLVRY